MKQRSAFNHLSDLRAEEIFRESPEEALAGLRLASIETDPFADTSSAIAAMAMEQPERFRELVGFLPPPIQDLFFQSYFLGRTQTQIGKLFGWSQSSGITSGVAQKMRLGELGICAVVAWGGPPEEEWQAAPSAKEKELLEAYRLLEKMRPQWEGMTALRVRAPGNLGEFRIRTDDPELEEHLAGMRAGEGTQRAY